MMTGDRVGGSVEFTVIRGTVTHRRDPTDRVGDGRGEPSSPTPEDRLGHDVRLVRFSVRPAFPGTAALTSGRMLLGHTLSGIEAGRIGAYSTGNGT